jgi:peptidoglycan/LPS O-acetylase OafA/YrhL
MYPVLKNMNVIKVLRFFLASSVIFSHSFSIVGVLDPISVTHKFSFGTLAVDGFFAVSGFLLYFSVQSSSPVVFIVKRYLRFFPLLAFVVLTSAGGVLVLSYVGLVSIQKYDVLSYVYTNLDLITLNRQYNINGVFAENVMSGNINGSLWSLNYEFWASMILLAIYTIFSRFKRVFFVCFCLGFVVLTQLAGHTETGNLDDFLNRLLPTFLIGSIAACFSKDLRKINTNVLRFISVMALSILICSVFFDFYFVISRFIWPLIFVPISISQEKKVAGIDLSYGVFLLGFPLGQIINSIGINNPLVLFGFTIVMVLPVAFLCTVHIEEKFSFQKLRDGMRTR